ncbi:unnamed protein product, partial [Symbiodinium sp. KB8]
ASALARTPGVPLSSWVGASPSCGRDSATEFSCPAQWTFAGTWSLWARAAATQSGAKRRRPQSAC